MADNFHQNNLDGLKKSTKRKIFSFLGEHLFNVKKNIYISNVSLLDLYTLIYQYCKWPQKSDYKLKTLHRGPFVKSRFETLNTESYIV